MSSIKRFNYFDMRFKTFLAATNGHRMKINSVEAPNNRKI
jgi:hypothetical protein